MHVINTNEAKALPYEQRDKNVLFNNSKMKLRIVELEKNEELPECEMKNSVVFHIIKGSLDLKVGTKSSTLKKGFTAVCEPGTYSMKAKSKTKLIGIMIL